jgi:hypothetical protein
MHDASLPGGLLHDGAVLRTVRFRPLTGDLELRLGDALEGCASLPDAVSELLGTALFDVGGIPANPALASALAVADRQWLMLKLAERVSGPLRWLTAVCNCGASFDVPLDLERVPFRPAGAGYPFADIEVGGQPLRARVPTGADQARIAPLHDDALALRSLLRACVVAFDGDLDALDYDGVSAVEAALDAVAPAVATELTTRCPGCGGERQVGFDPYRLAGLGRDGVLRDVHSLASHYHWGEAEILALPRERRGLYIGMIERGRGLVA